MVINHFKENILCTIKIAQTTKKSLKHADHKVYYVKQIFAKYCECGYKRIIRLLVLLLCNPCINVFNAAARVVEYCLNYNNYIILVQYICNMNRDIDHSAIAINYINNVTSKIPAHIAMKGKPYYYNIYNVVVFMYNCILINDGLLITAHGEH